ncbi:ThuA domain-containing protein [Flagellimonas allohymeniacidonis]|uniref:ThuA domain-containing protein n=1 Tax=Flagellimonas allohymeniacidonis TaxID=2517819 RepID=A0A4Q8QAY7_9FLAO|nr:ThuA domain-containing protein [Allomuricauda hymeniacidonis]TAI47431.1 ThuA domain-containing protein [Allomuricauda hymeniacidonis]
MNPFRTLCIALGFVCCIHAQETSSTEQDSLKLPDFILVFSKTEGYRHQSIEKGVHTLRRLGRKNGFIVLQTETSEDFNPSNLENYKLVIFLSTTQDVLNAEQQRAFRSYIKGGGSFMGIHAASDTEYDWPWYGKLVGGYFESHPNDPNVRDAKIDVVNKNHPSTAHLSDTWSRSDEWYNYKNLNPNITVLLNLDEKSYEGGTNGDNHPIAWHHTFDGGRAFYTGGGHTEESFDEPDFKEHLLGGILWCLGRAE